MFYQAAYVDMKRHYIRRPSLFIPGTSTNYITFSALGLKLTPVSLNFPDSVRKIVELIANYRTLLNAWRYFI